MASLEFLTSEGDLRLMQELSEELVAASKEFEEFSASSSQQEEVLSDASLSQHGEITPPQAEFPSAPETEPEVVADHPQDMEKIVFGPQPYRMLGE